MNKPLYEVNSHDGKKIFTLNWFDRENFLSGGEDGKVNLHELIN